MRPAGVTERIHFVQCFGFSNLQVRLAKVRRFRRIDSRFQVALLEEVAPALVVIRRTLAGFELSHCRLCVLPALDNLDDSGGPVGSDVMTDDDVGCAGFVACQRGSIYRLLKIPFLLF